MTKAQPQPYLPPVSVYRNNSYIFLELICFVLRSKWDFPLIREENSVIIYCMYCHLVVTCFMIWLLAILGVSFLLFWKPIKDSHCNIFFCIKLLVKKVTGDTWETWESNISLKGLTYTSFFRVLVYANSFRTLIGYIVY